MNLVCYILVRQIFLEISSLCTILSIAGKDQLSFGKQSLALQMPLLILEKEREIE